MSFLFECPHCAARKVIVGSAIGRRVRCPVCETLVEIALPAPAEPPPAAASITAENPEGLPVFSGVAISTPQLQPEWEAGTSSSMPGVPVLAMADDEEDEDKVVLKSHPEEAEMDMTPMIDVTFQLLIFFMVTASFTMQKALPIPAPKETQAAASTKTLQDYEEDPAYVTLRIDQAGTFFVTSVLWDDEKECGTEQELLAKLREARRGGQAEGASKMLVMAHGDAEHSRVVLGIDAGRSAGIDQIELLTIEDDDT